MSVVVEERRSARVGTVSGLALLVGGTAIAAAGGGTQSFFASGLLGLLTIGLGHSLAVEIKRQARRRSRGGWSRGDTINTVLLGTWAETALCAAILQVGPPSVRAVSVALALAYAACCGYFVTERRRAIAALTGDDAEAIHEDAEATEQTTNDRAATQPQAEAVRHG